MFPDFSSYYGAYYGLFKKASELAEKIKSAYADIPNKEAAYSEPLALVKKISQSSELLANLRSYKQ